MSEPHKPVGAIFDAAIELPAGQRAAYLQEACAGDDSLHQRVEALLRAHELAGTFMDGPAAHPKLQTVVIKPAEQPGDRIGRYKLLQQIGEGGCGVVYMAEQEEPVRRRVALKVIKLGMDTKSVIARFEAERQALALMDHPNIAKVLDAGATDAGRPYFVMELVRGIMITDYCDENNLSTMARLKLFIQVCQAIQHAHQKGIIHRDIKPSNILVADHDGVPVPKIIDFGIAKATTDQRLTDKTLFTAFEQFIGTPAYMSPEQARLSGLDIDTRSDIYSLGVLLYELLTAKTPFEAKRLHEMGLDEIRRIIREEEPLRPSTRLQTLDASEQTTVARHRQSEPPKLFGIINGDLDWIVMKALEKDRARRYETANGLAADIKRHLNNEPVIACPPSNVYRLQKLVRRNKLTFFAASAVIAALVIGLGISTWMFFKEQQARQQAEAQRKIAETEAAKATAISDFFQQSLRAANPDELKGSDYTVRRLLDDYAAGLDGKFTNQPEIEAAVRETMGMAYYRLGAPDKAQTHLDRALLLRRRLYGEHEQVAESLSDCAWNYFEQGQFAKGESLAREALDIYRKSGVVGQPVLSTLWVLQRNLIAADRVEDAEAVTEEASTLARKSLGVEFPEMASMIHGLAEVRIRQSRYAEAEALARKAVTMHRRLRREGDIETAWALDTLGRALEGEQKLDDAEQVLREALAIFRKQYSFGHKSVGATVTELKAVLEAKGDLAGLVALDQTILADQRSALGQDSPAVATTLSSLAGHLQSQGKQAEAEKALHEALGITLKSMGQDPASLPELLRQESQTLKALGMAAEAGKLYEDAIRAGRGRLGETNLILGELLHDYGEFLNHQGNMAAAAENYLQSLPIRRTQQNDDLSWTLRDLGGVLIQLGRYQEAEGYLKESLVICRRLHQQGDLYGTGWAGVTLGDALRHENKLPEAEQAYRDALSVYTKFGEVGSEDYASAVGSLLDVLQDENKPAEGEAVCREMLAQQRAAFTNGYPAVAETLIRLAANLAAQGHDAEVEEVLREALPIMQKSVGQNPAHREDFMKLGHLQWQLGQLLMNRHQPGEAEQLFLQALQVFETASKNFPSEPFLRQEQAYSHRLLGDLMASSGRWDESVRHYRAALGLYAALASGDPKSAFYLAEEAYTGSTLAPVLDHTGRPDEAVEELRRAADLDQKGTESFPDEKLFQQPATALFLQRATLVRISLTDILTRMKRYDEAEKAGREALALSTKLGAVGSEEYADVVHSLRDVLMAENKPAEVELLYEEVLAAQRSAPGNGSSAVALTLSELAGFLKSQNRTGEAAQTYQAALNIILKAPLKQFFKLSSTVIPELEAAGEKQQVTNICRAILDANPTNAGWLNNLSWNLAMTENPSNRDPALAVELAKRAAELEPMGGNWWSTLGTADYRAGDFKQAIADLEKAVRLEGGGSSYDFFFQAMAEHQVGHTDAAQRYYAKAIQWMNEHAPQNTELLRFRAEAEGLFGSEVKAEPSPSAK